MNRSKADNRYSTERMRVLIVGLCAALVLAGALLVQFVDQSPDEVRVLRVGTNVWPGYEPLYLARSLGMLDDRRVRLVEYSTATQVMRSFGNANIDVAALTLDEALLMSAKGVDLRVILVTDVSAGGDAIVTNPGISSLEEISGKRIGVENTALGAYVLSRAMQQANLEQSDITVVPVEVDEHEQAVADGRVDGVVTFEPVLSRLLAQGLVRVFDSSMIPGEITDVLVVRPETLGQHQPGLRRLVGAWFDALAYLDAEPQNAARLMSPRLGMAPAAVLAAYDGLHLPDFEENLEMLDPEAGSLRDSAANLARVMAELGLIEPARGVSLRVEPVLVRTLAATSR